jgi:hypothetical protein
MSLARKPFAALTKTATTRVTCNWGHLVRVRQGGRGPAAIGHAYQLARSDTALYFSDFDNHVFELDTVGVEP